MTPLARLPDWPARFHAFVDSVKREPFAWSSLDCASGFASGGVEALTGVDFAAPFRDRYRTRSEALRVLRAEGFQDLADLAASMLPEIPVCDAQLGDIAAIPGEGKFGHSLAIVNGERLLVMREEGLGTLDLFRAARAFKVG